MDTARRAVIDIGTNSIKLLVADVTRDTAAPVWEGSEQTRLGAGFYSTRRLQPAAIAQTAQAVTTFAGKAREMGAASIRVLATSAARDAVNPEELADAVERASGLKMRIISGDEEAEWAFRGVVCGPELAGQLLLLLDVGGGSTEFILGRDRHKYFSGSFRVGTVRLLELLPHSDPPTANELAACQDWIKEFLEREVSPLLRPGIHEATVGSGESPQLKLVGTGGTTTILARIEEGLTTYDRGRIEGMSLSLDRVRAQRLNLWSLPLAARGNIVGLPRERADVMLPGVAICAGVMEAFGIPELRVSTRGLRFAAVMDGAPN